LFNVKYIFINIFSGVASLKPQFAQPSPLINSSSSQPIETVEEHIMLKLESEVTSKIYMKCKNLKNENLDVCF